MFGRIALAGTVISGAAAAGFVVARQVWRTWGVDPEEADRTLPGDDLVADANAVETRGIDLDAPPHAVWPWLAQMGYGRAGWYSYDSMDMDKASARTIEPHLETPAVGDIVPTHPGGGFVVKAVEPERSLVLYMDREIAQRQAADQAVDPSPANLKAAGRFMDSATGDFAASWAFILTPTHSGGTRLIERARARMEAPEGARVILRPILGFGVFVMMRKQLLGIRERVHAVREPLEDRPVRSPAPA
jgi:hypothetical protein